MSKTKVSPQFSTEQRTTDALIALRGCVVRAKGNFAVDDHKALQALMLANSVLHELGIKLPPLGIPGNEDDKLPILPFPIGSIVRFKRHGSKRDTGMYLIDVYAPHRVEIEDGNVFTEYGILGHEKLGTHGGGLAWIAHDDLELVKYPDADTFAMLNAARDHEEGDDDDDDD